MRRVDLHRLRNDLRLQVHNGGHIPGQVLVRVVEYTLQVPQQQHQNGETAHLHMVSDVYYVTRCPVNSLNNYLLVFIFIHRTNPMNK